MDQWKGGKILQFNNKKKNYSIQIDQIIWTDAAPKKIYIWPISTWKDAPHHYTPGKFNFKPQIVLCTYCNGYN